NLARVLEESVRELPRVKAQPVRPRLHPKLVVREHQERDGKIFAMCIPGGRPLHYFRLNEAQFQISQLFDGERTAEDVAQIAAEKLNLQYSADEVTKFIEALEATDFWYHTPQEKSVALCHHLMGERHRRTEPEGDLAQIVLFAFDPDNYLNWVKKHFDWIYSRWFSCWSLFMLLVAFAILGSHWQQVWADSVNFWNLAGRGVGHFLAFMAAFLLLGAIHETAHGLTCKHFGGEVHRMGAMLVYMTPCIFCDVSQAWVYGDRWERMLTVFFGVWSEIVVCTYASVIWWVTAPGTFLHDACYLIILAGGIFCVLVNWNPFAKMDGYMLCTEYFRIHDIKAETTQWLVSWIRVKIFDLPGEVRALSPLKTICYPAYALLSGVYCYSLLLFFVRIVYHILQYYTPQWAFLPAGLLMLRIFRSRILKLGQFMKELYVDKKDVLRAHRMKIAAGVLAVLVVGLLPLRRDVVTERFVLEPVQRVVLRAQVPGRVTEVGAEEGQSVTAGAAVATLSDLQMQTEVSRSAAEYHEAEARAVAAQLHYADYGAARQKLTNADAAYRSSIAKNNQLAIVSPIAGVVISPRMKDLLGSYVDAGAQVAEVADTSSMRARVFVPQPEMRKLRTVHDVALRMDSKWGALIGSVVSISPASQLPDPGMTNNSDYQGIKLPEFFVVTVALANPNAELRDGMTGTAKIHGRRRSILGIAFEPLVTAVARRLW
ncbi:MAG: efflux RND transporter periplasmic adaptor subunit, partial [Terriglobales bacterium]